jgi:hypothetical protein
MSVPVQAHSTIAVVLNYISFQYPLADLANYTVISISQFFPYLLESQHYNSNQGINKQK